MTGEGAVAPEGLLVVDKPAGLSSHDVVARVRRLAGTRRVGHAGTLDPMATGVLVLGVGRATRLLGHLSLSDKAYEATARLGVTTTTDDADGEVVATADAGGLPVERVREAAGAFRGTLRQVPSRVSAIKVDGRRAYARARAGEAFDLEPRVVTVSELQVVDVRPGDAVVDVDLRLVCSSGTYVRAIARDLGAALGVGGHLTALRRTRVGPYDLSAARTLDQLAERVDVVPLAAAAAAAFPTRTVDDDTAARLRHGVPLPPTGKGGPVAVLDAAGELLALVEDTGDRAKPLAVFAPAT